MSTKATISYGDTFHLYHDMGDANHVYLEINTTQFEAEYGRVMLPIPVHIWEFIREYPGVRLDLAGLSDAQLHEKAVREVDERIQMWRDLKNRKAKSFLIFSILRNASDPRPKQIRKALRYYLRQRQWQRQVSAAIEKLRWENSPEGMKHRREKYNRRASRLQAARKTAKARKRKTIVP